MSDVPTSEALYKRYVMDLLAAFAYTPEVKTRIANNLLKVAKDLLRSRFYLVDPALYVNGQLSSTAYQFHFFCGASGCRNIFHFYRHHYRQDISRFRLLLSTLYPELFPSDRKKFVLLQTNVDKEIIKEHPEFKALPEFYMAIGRITGDTRYLAAVLASGAVRMDLQGGIEVVTDEQRDIARSILMVRTTRIQQSAKRRERSLLKKQAAASQVKLAQDMQKEG
jgi:ProQ/FINO family